MNQAIIIATHRVLMALLAIIGLTAAAITRADAQAPQPVSVIVFPGGFNWPIWIAQDKGFFAKDGIEVKLTPTPNSVFQLTNLIDGKFDIAITAIDNVIAYMEGQGEAETTAKPDLVVFMGGDNGFLNVVTIPEVKSFADIKGKTVSVDALTTGYAFVLFDLLKRNGLQAGDYNIEKVGGVSARWAAIKEKKQAAALLITPFDIFAKAAGLNVLQYAIDLYGHYQGLVGAARREWAAKNPKLVEAYIRGTIAGVDFLRDPKNKDEAIAILRKHLPQMTEDVAAQSYTTMAGAKGFTPKAAIDIEGVRKVLALRSEYSKPQKAMTDPMKYYDATYYNAALR
jgi:ABC-type nitrate/sulfonate/bicarbonate transport system substrate-binding protein